MNELEQFVRTLDPAKRHEWAWDNYRRTIIGLIEKFDLRRVIEVGGGRSPYFTPEQIDDLRLDYTVNDISQRELDRIESNHYRTVCADISKERVSGKYDLIFSKMVYEHVTDNQASMENQFSMLNDGGIALHFHPVLFASPFIINLLLPEVITSHVLRLVAPRRHDDDVPKFPARYSWCFATEKQRRRLLDIGFAEVQLVPFFGHNYYEKFPLIRSLSRWVSSRCAARDIRSLASYCYTICRK